MVERPASIETQRLLLLVLLLHELEPLVAGDVERAGRLAGVNFPPGWPEEREAREGLSTHIPWRIRLIVERSSSSVVGSINLKGPPSPDGDVEIGWGVVEHCRRRGYALEAAAAVTAWVLAQPGVNSLSATVPSDNVASQRLAAKLGMTLTGDTRRSLPLWKLKTA